MLELLRLCRHVVLALVFQQLSILKALCQLQRSRRLHYGVALAKYMQRAHLQVARKELGHNALVCRLETRREHGKPELGLTAHKALFHGAAHDGRKGGALREPEDAVKRAMRVYCGLHKGKPGRGRVVGGRRRDFLGMGPPGEHALVGARGVVVGVVGRRGQFRVVQRHRSIEVDEGVAKVCQRFCEGLSLLCKVAPVLGYKLDSRGRKRSTWGWGVGNTWE